jgi:N-acetylmuramic acid 6-phosphate etherase
MRFHLSECIRELDISELSPLHEHLLLKMLLNAHSTLVMGRLGRFESNVMTWVRPSNNKLIDRSIRYVEHLLGEKKPSYEKICLELFRQIETLEDGESVVLKTVAALK